MATNTNTISNIEMNTVPSVLGGHGGGGPTGVQSFSLPIAPGNSGGIRTQLGKMYSAFGDYEQEARQRKYMIAELEDTIAGLDETLKNRQTKSKELTIQVEKLKAESQAVEAGYEKSVNDKKLIENEYKILSNEMDALSEEMQSKQALLKKMEAVCKEKLEIAAAKEIEFTNEYMKIPAIAELQNLKNECENIQLRVHNLKMDLENRNQEVENLKAERSQGWVKFVKNCVLIGESSQELRKMIMQRNGLRQECAKASKRPAPVPMSVQPFSSQVIFSQTTTTTRSVPEQEPISKKFETVANPRLRRPSAFRQMDNMFKKPEIHGFQTGSYTNRHSEMMPPPRSPARAGPGLISHLRSTLKAPVAVTPMPREPPSTPVQTERTQEVAENITAVANMPPKPTEKDVPGVDEEELLGQPKPKKSMVSTPQVQLEIEGAVAQRYEGDPKQHTLLNGKSTNAMMVLEQNQQRLLNGTKETNLENVGFGLGKETSGDNNPPMLQDTITPNSFNFTPMDFFYNEPPMSTSLDKGDLFSTQNQLNSTTSSNSTDFLFDF